jgi:hypothetical protein
MITKLQIVLYVCMGNLMKKHCSGVSSQCCVGKISPFGFEITPLKFETFPLEFEITPLEFEISSLEPHTD